MFDLNNLDFTLNKFCQLCSAVAVDYPTLTMAEYLSAKNLPERFVLMRHDIDRKPKNALNTARIEQEFRIRATYYFRVNSKVFHPEIMQEIEGMGHEVGYHYEVLGKAKGSYNKAMELFEYELSELRKICDIKTICMHGDPLSKYDNRDLWKTYDFRDFGIIGEAYLSAGKDVNYFSDTGRSWNSKNNMRDFMPDKREKKTVDTTDGMIGLLRSNKINKLYILTHPERWGNGMNWSFNYMTDLVLNTGKKMLLMVRG